MVGAIFKINHWPGANVLITVGLVLLAYMFFPMALVNSYKMHKDASQKPLYWAVFITSLITLTGMLFKIMHWPGAGILLLFGLPLPFVYFLPLYIHYHNKTKSIADSNFFGIVFFFIYVAVFSSLLALQVSKDVLDSYAVSIHGMEMQKQALENKIKRSANTGNNELLEKGDYLVTELEELKKDLAIMRSPSNEVLMNSVEKNYFLLREKTTRYVFFQYIEISANNANLEALNTDIQNFFIQAKNRLSSTSHLPVELIKNSSLTEMKYEDISLIGSMQYLTQIQKNIRLAEYLILTSQPTE